MKIICSEEHVFDAAIAQATRIAVIAEAGYMADWDCRAKDGLREVYAPNIPHLVSEELAMKHSLEMGESRIVEMDKYGIDMQILSYGVFPQFLEGQQAIDLIRAANNRLSDAINLHPTRLAGLAMLPWQATAEAVIELERVVNRLGLRGVLLMGRPGNTFLDDVRYEPILAKLHELNTPLYVHPGIPLPAVRDPYYGGFDRELSARLSLFAWGWHNEAGIQVIRMILAGIFEKYPGLQIISGHWGEMVPFFLQRLDDSIPQDISGLASSITETYRRHVYVTPSGMLYVPHFEFIHKILGADRIIYSSDYPYFSLDGTKSFIESLPVSLEDKEKIAYLNVQKLLNL